MSTTQQRLERQFGQLEVSSSSRPSSSGQQTYGAKKVGPVVPPKPKYSPPSSSVTIHTASQSYKGPGGQTTSSSHRTVRYSHDSDDDLPPPPPTHTFHNYSPDSYPPPPHDDFPLPPSPTTIQQIGYSGPAYGRSPSPQASSTVTVKKRGYPQPYVSPSQQQQQLAYASSPPPQSPSMPKGGKPEAEVDALTNLLVQSMDSRANPDVFASFPRGSCAKCHKQIVGDGGCSAMDQMFHIECFVCCICARQLRGVPFYAVEGKPYCEEDYFNTLEKCSVCSKPIMDRILRATGKPYHPSCFTCVVCGKSLDGIPFTVDATNQIHCIEDFHRKFAPRCAMCHQPIMPETGQEETVRIVALDKSFHVDCYRCEDCGTLLSSQADGRGCYPLDDHVLCRQCNATRINDLTNRMSTEL